VPIIPRNLPVPCGGLPSFVVGPAVRIIEVYLNKLDETVVAADDIAEVLRGIVRVALLVSDTNLLCGLRVTGCM
jgi:hypothetical protein